MTETVLVDNLEFEVRRSTRRKSLGLTVDRGGELVVHAPDAITPDELKRWVGRKLLWVHRKLALKNEMKGSPQNLTFVSGESIFYLGRSYRIKLVDDPGESLRFDGHWFHLCRVARSTAAKHFQEWFTGTGMRWLSNRMLAWQQKVCAVPARICIGDLGYRWGSCGKNGVVYFNWRLLQLPVRLIDYVIVHELVHLIEHSHRREFWRIMDCTLPDWADRKKCLESTWHTYVTFRVSV